MANADRKEHEECEAHYVSDGDVTNCGDEALRFEALDDTESLHPADIADRLEAMPVEEQIEAVLALPLEDAAEGLGEMEEHARLELLNRMDPDMVADLMSEMAFDDAADLLDEMDDDRRDDIMRRLEREDATSISDLMRYDPDTAGGVMNSEIVILDHGLTVDQAIRIMRREIEDKEIPYYAYLVDENECLVGVASMREILTSPPGRLLKDLVKGQNLITVVFDVDKEEVAHQLRHYNFLALPVVDYGNKLLGVVTHDDIIDIIHEEASEDMLGMVGAGQDETVDTPWKRSTLQRLPWLLLNVLNSSLGAWVVFKFEGTIAQMAVLAALMPIVANQAGNTGQQSLAVIVRQLAMERFDRGRAWGAVAREFKIGVSNGLVIGSIVFCIVLLLMNNAMLAMVMALALGSNMIIGAVAGGSIPLILRELGRDPAQASSIFLTTLTDTLGFLIFLGLAHTVLF
ncbi:MAG: magnesium transporter [Desulfovibrionaceae bacterium]